MLRLGHIVSVLGGHVRSLSLYGVHPFGLPLGYLGSKSIEVQSVWEVYDDRLQFMTRHGVVALDESLHACDVSRAWLVWSSAAETALADTFRFAEGGPVPDRGLVLGRGAARMRTVRLGGPLKRSIRRSAADAGEGDDVHLKRDSFAAPLLDLRRRLKAILDVLDGLIRHRVSLSRSVELFASVGSGFTFGTSCSRHSGRLFCCSELWFG